MSAEEITADVVGIARERELEWSLQTPESLQPHEKIVTDEELVSWGGIYQGGDAVKML